MSKKCLNELIAETKKQGIILTTNRNDINKDNVLNWVYREVTPSFVNAIKWAKVLGLKFNMSKEEVFVFMKKYGIKKSAEKSGVKIRTICAWRYSGVEPPLDKIERIMMAIGKPLELVEQEDE